MFGQLSHDDYMQSCRKKAAEIAAGILAGSLQVLEGCRQLGSLASSVGISEDDPDFAAFKLIDSETDALPIGAVRAHWATDALAEIEPTIESAIAWAEPIALPACRSVMERFGVELSRSTPSATQLNSSNG